MTVMVSTSPTDLYKRKKERCQFKTVHISKPFDGV